MARDGAELVYQFERPFIVDGSKYRRTFGGDEATPHREGIRQTLEWYRSNPRAGAAGRTSPWWRGVLRYGRAPARRLERGYAMSGARDILENPAIGQRLLLCGTTEGTGGELLAVESAYTKSAPLVRPGTTTSIRRSASRSTPARFTSWSMGRS